VGIPILKKIFQSPTRFESLCHMYFKASMIGKGKEGAAGTVD
jgi:hypothetical protein